MADSMGLGFMAAFAVSGSVVLIAREVHKRLLSDFLKKIEFELGGSKKCQSKKKVRFADDVMEPSSDNKEYRRRHLVRIKGDQVNFQGTCDGANRTLETMPVNRQILYKGIIQYKTLKGCNMSSCF